MMKQKRKNHLFERVDGWCKSIKCLRMLTSELEGRTSEDQQNLSVGRVKTVKRSLDKLSGTAGKLVSKAVFEASFFLYLFIIFAENNKKGVCIEDARQCGREAKEKNIFVENKEKGSMHRSRAMCGGEAKRNIFAENKEKGSMHRSRAMCGKEAKGNIFAENKEKGV